MVVTYRGIALESMTKDALISLVSKLAKDCAKLEDELLELKYVHSRNR